MNEVVPRTKRGAEWNEFADKVLTHIDTYAVPQYRDKGEDDIHYSSIVKFYIILINVTKWTAKDCMLAIKKYISRFEKNSRKGQEKLDMLKVAHYACLIHNKLGEGE